MKFYQLFYLVGGVNPSYLENSFPIASGGFLSSCIRSQFWNVTSPKMPSQTVPFKMICQPQVILYASLDLQSVSYFPVWLPCSLSFSVVEKGNLQAGNSSCIILGTLRARNEHLFLFVPCHNAQSLVHYWLSTIFFFLVFFVFLGLRLQHVEVPRLGVQLELEPQPVA